MDDPVENQYVMNVVDGLPYFYRNGEWHRFCDCPLVVVPPQEDSGTVYVKMTPSAFWPDFRSAITYQQNSGSISMGEGAFTPHLHGTNWAMITIPRHPTLNTIVYAAWRVVTNDRTYIGFNTDYLNHYVNGSPGVSSPARKVMVLPPGTGNHMFGLLGSKHFFFGNAEWSNGVLAAWWWTQGTRPDVHPAADPDLTLASMGA